MPITSKLMLSGSTCIKCGGTLSAKVEAAAHDPQSLDIVVVCEGDCGRALNTFVELESMMELD